jgi:hypothetical protein
MLAAQMAAIHIAMMTFAATRHSRQHTAAGQRRARAQQARANVHNPDGDAKALPDWRPAECYGASRVRE